LCGDFWQCQFGRYHAQVVEPHQYSYYVRHRLRVLQSVRAPQTGWILYLLDGIELMPVFDAAVVCVAASVPCARRSTVAYE
jgi:hypothetical protein